MIKLNNEEGEWLEEEEEINEAFAKFYSELFATSGRRDMEEALYIMEQSVTTSDNMTLERDVSLEEIKMAAFQLNGAKAPGPDGFSGKVYQAA